MDRRNGRMVGWASAGLVALAGGVALAVLAMGASPARVPDGAAGDQTSDTQAAQKARVKVVRPQVGPLERTTTQPAHLEPLERVEVHARISGYLRALGQATVGADNTRPLDIGDRVAKDHILAELWVPEMEQDVKQKEVLVEQAQADLAQARASLEASRAQVVAARARATQASAEVGRYEAEVAYRKSEHDRYRQLLAERTVQRELVDERSMQHRAAESALAGARAAITSARAMVSVEQAKENKAAADVKSAEARVKVARANLEQAVVLFAYRRVRAPFAAVITRRMVDTGAFVQSASAGKAMPLFTLVRADERTGLVQVRIVTDIPETETPWVKVGQKATLRIDALRGHEFPATVVRLADALDSSTRTMRVELAPDELSAGLRPGLYGSARVVLARYASAVLLPTSALLPAEGKPAVMIVEKGLAKRRRIEIGINDGIRMQVVGGLKGDEQVITDGKDGLRDGEAVEVVP